MSVGDGNAWCHFSCQQETLALSISWRDQQDKNIICKICHLNQEDKLLTYSFFYE